MRCIFIISTVWLLTLDGCTIPIWTVWAVAFHFYFSIFFHSLELFHSSIRSLIHFSFGFFIVIFHSMDFPDLKLFSIPVINGSCVCAMRIWIGKWKMVFFLFVYIHHITTLFSSVQTMNDRNRVSTALSVIHNSKYHNHLFWLFDLKYVYRPFPPEHFFLYGFHFISFVFCLGLGVGETNNFDLCDLFKFVWVFEV